MAVGIERSDDRLRATVWTLGFSDEPVDASVNAARLAIVDGCLGTRAVSEAWPADRAQSAVRVAGIYGPEPPGLLAPGPAWTPVAWPAAGRHWSLDMRTGQLDHHLVVDGDELTTTRFAIAGEPGCQAYVAPDQGVARLPIATPEPTVLVGADGTLAALVAADRTCESRFVRVVAAAVATSADEALGRAGRRAARLVARGPSALLDRQRAAWADRWAGCSVSIEGDAVADVRTRFALYCLLALSDHGRELPLGARGLTGAAYGGHVFWDSDVFVLPALASVAPTAARAMVEYRLRRLDAARRFAVESGAAGARFPWESAATGVDVTPRSAPGLGEETLIIQTGQQERHISADIVWALRSYQRWTGDDEVLACGGAEVVTEIARYLATEVEIDDAGVGHISGVIGPDEYHEGVTDNAFTNRMTAWALREAVGLTEDGWDALATVDERREWARTADRIETGYDTRFGRHLQFAGFDRLDPGLAYAVAEPPVAADLLLGREAVQRSQLIKQADVLMMHQLIPDELPPGSLANDIAFYLPRTSHGSSLSPAIHAAVLARAGRPDEALHWYRIALAMDTDDLSRTGAGGLHYANIGGIWQALLGGFLGLRATVQGLAIGPQLPTPWERVVVGCRYGGTAIAVDARHDRVELTADSPITIMLDGVPSEPTAHIELRRSDAGGWRWR